METDTITHEDTDVVIVGARCAGSAAAVALANRGVRVIAVDGARFPSDTLSTHLLWPSTLSELDRVGALGRVRALDAPDHLVSGVSGGGIDVVGPYPAVDGIGHGGCIRRPGLDMALVETAREAGAEVREGVRVQDLLRDEDGRVTGVRWKTRDGDEGTITARLVIGADGRHSTVAKLVDTEAHHEWENRRMMAFAYVDDPRADERHVAMQWRVGDELGCVFPCDGDRSLVLLMPPVSHASAFKSDPTAAFEAGVAGIPALAERVEGCTRATKVRMSLRHPSYFRHSHGPGWALAGDAGHFKDPVTAQGIRDALRFGRLLGEAVAPALAHGPGGLDRALATWEDDRDRQCLDMYQWANGLGLDDALSPVELAAYGQLAEDADGMERLHHVFARTRSPWSLFNGRNAVRWALRAVREGRAPRGEVVRTVGRDVGREARRRREQVAFTRRRAASARRRHDRLAAERAASPAPAPAAPERELVGSGA